MISTEAGTRLAKATAALEAMEEDEEVSSERMKAARLAFGKASRAVGHELVAQGFHEKEGD